MKECFDCKTKKGHYHQWIEHPFNVAELTTCVICANNICQECYKEHNESCKRDHSVYCHHCREYFDHDQFLYYFENKWRESFEPKYSGLCDDCADEFNIEKVK